MAGILYVTEQVDALYFIVYLFQLLKTFVINTPICIHERKIFLLLLRKYYTLR